MSLDNLINEQVREHLRAEVRAEVRALLPELMAEVASGNEVDFIDTREVARRTGLSKQFFECGRSKKDPNQPRHYKVGRRVLYSWTEVEEWFRHRREA